MTGIPGELPYEHDPNTVMIANESFATTMEAGGRLQEVTVIKGKTRVAASHELARRFPRYFDPAEGGLTYRNEEAGGPRPSERRRPS